MTSEKVDDGKHDASGSDEAQAQNAASDEHVARLLKLLSQPLF